MFTRTLVIASLIAISTAAAASTNTAIATVGSDASHLNKIVVLSAKQSNSRSVSNAAMDIYRCKTDPLHCTAGNIN